MDSMKKQRVETPAQLAEFARAHDLPLDIDDDAPEKLPAFAIVRVDPLIGRYIGLRPLDGAPRVHLGDHFRGRVPYNGLDGMRAVERFTRVHVEGEQATYYYDLSRVIPRPDVDEVTAAAREVFDFDGLFSVQVLPYDEASGSFSVYIAREA